ncbi:MAG: outer membrane beta-barrel protein [Candidatus Aegiribacteria sp.]|nr:outer membrane beta-barrel protein [Candidatus Aegiribacteria sp.]
MTRISTMSLVVLVCFAGVSEAGGVYIGPKGGMMIMGLTDVDNIVSLGGMIGYGAPSGISAEVEFNYGVSGGGWTPMPGATADFNIWTVAGYGAYRLSMGSGAYLKGKMGILRESVDAEATIPLHGSITMSGNDTGLSLGIGAGYNFVEMVMAEIEVTIIEKDVTLISLGVSYSL